MPRQRFGVDLNAQIRVGAVLVDGAISMIRDGRGSPKPPRCEPGSAGGVPEGDP
jgi:hypothetical protein